MTVIFPRGSVTYPATYKIQNLFKSLPVLRFDRDENPTWWINQEIVLNEYNRNCLNVFQLSLKTKKKRVHYAFLKTESRQTIYPECRWVIPLIIRYGYNKGFSQRKKIISTIINRSNCQKFGILFHINLNDIF